MTGAPRKPFWKRKRWIAAAVLWLMVAYPLSTGPAAYAIERGWIAPFGRVNAIWLPVMTVCERIGMMPRYIRWCQWWSDLARQHDSPSL